MNKKVRWSDVIRRSRSEWEERGVFYIIGSRPHLFGYDGYDGCHDLLERIIAICESHVLKPYSFGQDSPLNIADHEFGFSFLDGGLDVYAGNYFQGEHAQGAYIRGVWALHWLLCELGIEQPRKLTEEMRPTPCELLTKMVGNPDLVIFHLEAMEY